MKKQLKLAALAAAVLATGAANAAVSASTGNGSFLVYAYNTVTTSYYLRDLGVQLNSFLPSSVGPGAAGDNPLAGDKTPEAGLTVNFAADQSFVDWVGGAASNIKWGAFALDSLNSAAGGVARLIVASAQSASAFNPTNGQVSNAVANANFNGFALAGNSQLTGTSITFPSGATATSPVNTAGGLGVANNIALGSSGSLYYYTRTGVTAGASVAANEFTYSNSANTASFTLNGDGSVTYALAPAAVSQVPLPGAVWLMGAGLAAMGGVIRRRKAAAEA